MQPVAKEYERPATIPKTVRPSQFSAGGKMVRGNGNSVRFWSARVKRRFRRCQPTPYNLSRNLQTNASYPPSQSPSGLIGFRCQRISFTTFFSASDQIGAALGKSFKKHPHFRAPTRRAMRASFPLSSRSAGPSSRSADDERKINFSAPTSLPPGGVGLLGVRPHHASF
jgi:hypothetical protein